MSESIGEWKGTWVLQSYLDGQLNYWDGSGTTQDLERAKHFPSKQEALDAIGTITVKGKWEPSIGHAP